MDACRAGAWPTPAVTTLPMITSSTWSGRTPARVARKGARASTHTEAADGPALERSSPGLTSLLQRALDGGGAEVRREDRGEGAADAADRRARGANNDDVLP